MSITANYRTIKRNGKTLHRCVLSLPADNARGRKEKVTGTYKTRDEAYAEIFRQRVKIDAGHYDESPYTFGEAVQRYLHFRRIKPATREKFEVQLRTVLKPYMNMPLRDVSQMRAEFEDLLDGMNPGRATTVNKLLSETCDRAMAEGRIEGHRLSMMATPVRIHKNRPLVPHTAQQLNTLLAVVPGRYRLGILLGRGCGLRVSEFSAMQTDAIHDGYLEVSRACTKGYDGLPKQRNEGFTPRKVPIPYWLEPEIARHVELFANDDGVFFPRRKYGFQRKIYTNEPPSIYASYRTMNVWFQKGTKAAGLDGFTFHQLRKNYATQLRDEASDLGIEWGDIEEWLGHKNLTRDSYAFQGDNAIDRGRKLSDPRI